MAYSIVLFDKTFKEPSRIITQIGLCLKNNHMVKLSQTQKFKELTLKIKASLINKTKTRRKIS